MSDKALTQIPAYYIVLKSGSPQIIGWQTLWHDEGSAVPDYAVPSGYEAVVIPDMTADLWADFQQNQNGCSGGLAYEGGKIIPYSPPATLSGQQAALAAMTAQKKALGVYFQPTYASAPVLFPSDDTAYANALQQAQVAQLGAWTDGTAWTLADGSSVPMTGDDVTALFKKLAKYRGACQTHAAALNATLQHDLNTDLTAGWPDNH